MIEVRSERITPWVQFLVSSVLGHFLVRVRMPLGSRGGKGPAVKAQVRNTPDFLTSTFMLGINSDHDKTFRT